MSDSKQKSASKKRLRAKRYSATRAKATRAYQEAFLESFKKIGTIVGACSQVGIDRQTVLNWRNKDVLGFKKRFEDANVSFTELLETIAHQRATSNSDTMLIFMLKARRPEVYRERFEHEHKGKITEERVQRLVLVFPEAKKK